MRMMGMMLSMMDITSGVPILPSLRCQHTKPDGDIQYKKVASICLKPKSFALFDFQNLKKTFPFCAFHNVAPGNFHLKLDSQMTGGTYMCENCLNQDFAQSRSPCTFWGPIFYTYSI